MEREWANEVVVLDLRYERDGARVGAVVVGVIVDGISDLTGGIAVNFSPGNGRVEFLDVPVGGKLSP